MKPFLKLLLIRALPVALVAVIGAAILSRGPNYPVEWSREVPSKEALTALSPALGDLRNWPIFHHALKSVTLFENGRPVEGFDRIVPGMTAVFAIEPKGKEWKRFDIRAVVLPPRSGESLRFRMIDESTGKTTRLLEGFEWWLGFRTATEAEAKRGNLTYVVGGAMAETKTARARFFGRFAPKILMNQLYQVDLVRLANFPANMATWAQDHPPVYR